MSQKKSTEKEFKYVCFEVCLIPYIDKRIGEIFNYSIVKYSKEINIDDNLSILNETIRMYYDNKLPGDITSFIESSFDNAEVEQHFRGYDLGVFDGEAEREAITTWLLHDENLYDDIQAFIDDCKPYAQLNKAMYSLSLTNGNYEGMINAYKRIEKVVSSHESSYGRDGLVMVKTGMIISFANEDKDYHDFDILRAYLAIKSIIGNKDFAGTNKGMICARMIGAKTPAIAQDLIRDKTINKNYVRITGRYFFDKLLMELQVKCFITSKITFGKSMYFSTKLNSELLSTAIVNHAENRLINSAGVKLKKEEKELRNRIANKLNNR